MTTSTADSQRAALIERIRKLSKFTTQAGCSEHEAQAALAKVRELIAAHNVTQTELSVRFEASRCITDEFIELNMKIGDWTSCATAIAALYSTRCWYVTANEDVLGLGFTTPCTKIKFFGLASDVAACIATCSIIYTAVNTEAIAFKGHRVSFRLGMIARLCERLRSMKSEEPRAATGTSLVVLKNALVTEEFAKRNLRLRSQRGTSAHSTNSAAYNAGKAAGSRVDLGGGKIAGQRQLGSR